MMVAGIYIETDRKNTRKSKKKYGYVLECEVRGETKTREGFGKVEGTYHKATLEALIEALGRFRKQCEIHIYSEDTFVLNMFRGNLELWEENGYTTSKGKEVANKEEWEKVRELTKRHKIVPEPGKHAYSSWIMEELARRGTDALGADNSR